MSREDRKPGRKKRGFCINRWSYVDPPEVCVWMETIWQYGRGNLSYYGDVFMPPLSDIFGGAGAPPRANAFEDAAFAEQYPTVYLLMTQTKNDQGVKRQVCSLTLVCEDGQLKLGLRERDLDLSLWTSSPTLAQAFSALEEALAVRPSQWRRPGGKGKGR